MMRWVSLLAPVLAAAFPVLFLYAHNVNEVSASSVVPVLLIAVVASILLTALLWFLLRDHAKASMVATAWILLFLMYGHIHDQLAGVSVLGVRLGSHPFLVPVSLAVAVVIPWAVLRTRRSPARSMPYVTVVIGALVLFNIASIGIPEARATDKAANDPGDFVAPSNGVVPTDLRDIYFIVPDRYPANSTLLDYFEYDNSEFTEYLEDSGFYVADQSISNYHRTFLSLASSLNMTYLDVLDEQVGGEKTSDKGPAMNMVQDHVVWRTLKEQYGYKFVHFGSWWGPTAGNPHADTEITKHPRLFGAIELGDAFHRQLFTTTALWAFENQVLVRDAFSQSDAEIDRCKGLTSTHTGHPNNETEEQCHRALHTFEQLREMPSAKGPKFVFVHLLLPHPPFIFGPDGETHSPPPYYYWNRLSKEQHQTIKDAFVDQLQFTNKMLKETIDNIRANSPREPIIVVQADEGPWTPEFPGQANRGELTPETLQIRHRILSAYHLPGVDEDTLYPSITPVNTFRVIFNEYFGADLPLLDDRAYRSAGHNDDLYHFIDVTDQVRPGE